MSGRDKDGKRRGKREIPTPSNSNLTNQNTTNTPDGNGVNNSQTGGQSGEEKTKVPATTGGKSQNKVPKKNTQVDNCYNNSDKPTNKEGNNKTQTKENKTHNKTKTQTKESKTQPQEKITANEEADTTNQETKLTALEILKQCKGLEDLGIDIETVVEELCLPTEELEQLEPDVALARVRAFLQEVNEIRVQLARLDTNLAGLVYYENEVFPLLNLLFLLAGVATDYSLFARNLIQVSVARTSKVKDACDLSYDVLRLSEDVYDLVEYKSKKLLRILSNS